MKTISYILVSLVILLFLYGAWDCNSCMKGLIHTEGFDNEQSDDSTNYKNVIKENMKTLTSQSIEYQKKLKQLLNSGNSEEMNEDAKAILNS